MNSSDDTVPTKLNMSNPPPDVFILLETFRLVFLEVIGS